MIVIRSVLFVIWLYGSMAVVGLLGLPTMLISRRAALSVMRVHAHCVVFGLRWISGIKVEFRGLDLIPEGPLLVAGKHQSMLDIYAPLLMFRDPIIVMKRELLWYPVLGWYSMRTKMIPIDRNGTARTMKLMLKAAQDRVPEGRGRQMIIFPEGTRGTPGQAPAYQSAGIRAFYKALDLPLVPVATNSGLCWPAHGLRRTPGTVVFEVLPAIEAGLAHKEMLPRLIEALERASTHLNEEAHARS